MSTKILSVDTSAKVASACIFDNEIIDVVLIDKGLTHSETLAPLVNDLLNENNIDINSIDYLAVNVGPGSFTGIRIGVSFIKGIATVINKPCIGTSTLESMAYNYIDSNDTYICSLIDARNNHFYNSLFYVDNTEVKRLTDDRVISSEKLIEELENSNKKYILVGDGANLFYSLNSNSDCIEIAQKDKVDQKASSVAILAKREIDNNKTIDASMLAPIYLRLSQAERELKEKQNDSNRL